MDQQMLERVLHLSSGMAETRQLTPFLEYALSEAMSLVGAESGYIVVIKPDGSLDFRICRGADRADAQDQISLSVLTRVIQTRQPLILDDAVNSPDGQLSERALDLHGRSVMCVPLMVHGDVIGLIYLETRSVKGRFHADELTLLTLLANQAAVSIENVNINDEIEARVAARTHELEQAKAEIEQHWIELNDARTHRLTCVTNDLRNPLSFVIQSLELFQEGAFGDLSDEQINWIPKLLDAMIMMSNLTNDISDLVSSNWGICSEAKKP